jgi:iron complex outermembrane receptor protein
MKTHSCLVQARRCCVAIIAMLLVWGLTVTRVQAQTPSAPPAAPPAQSDGATAPSGTGKETELPEVVVSDKKEAKPPVKEGSADVGYRSTTSTVGPLGTVPVLDTPFSINVVPGELIENREAHTTYDALATNPAVSNLMVSNTYSSMSRVMIRGFTAADQGEFRDGLVDRSFTVPPLENVDRIEVLNGLSGFLYGFAEPGGTINYISKQPTSSLLGNLSYGNYGGGINYLQADVGGPIPLVKGLTTRLNAYREYGDTYIHNGTDGRTLLSDTLAYQLSPKTVLKADAYYQDDHVQGLQTYFNASGGNWVGDKLKVPSASAFDPTKQYGQPWTYDWSQKTLVGLGLDSKLSSIFTLRTGVRYGQMWRNYDYVDATLSDNSGNYKEQFTTTPAQHETTHASYALVDAAFDTRSFHHDLTFGYTGCDYHYNRGTDVPQSLGASNITSPAVFSNPNLAVGPDVTHQGQPQMNLLVGDRIRLNRFLSALVGVTFAQIKQEAWGANPVTNYTQHAFTPSLALIYKPHSNVSTYFSYMQGLVAGGTAPGTNGGVAVVNAYQTLGPSVYDQYEIGAKAALRGVQLTAALFRINAVNEEVNPSDEIYQKDGREVHQGAEVTSTGKLTNRLTLVGGFTLMRARIDKATANPAEDGKIPLDVPEQQARAHLEYKLPFHLTPALGINYSGRRPVDSINANYFSGATVFDAGLRYQPSFLGHRTSLNLYVSNVGDKRYWTYYRSGDGLLLGEPRVAAFSVKGEW